jgi:hypothetical protein
VTQSEKPWVLEILSEKVTVSQMALETLWVTE